MGMTITEKILAKSAGKDTVKAGDLVDANIDVVMCHDVTTPPAISMLVEKGIDKVFDSEKIVVTPDHFQPAKDIKSAELHKRLDTWAKRHKIKYYYKIGRAGYVTHCFRNRDISGPAKSLSAAIRIHVLTVHLRLSAQVLVRLIPRLQ